MVLLTESMNGKRPSSVNFSVVSSKKDREGIVKVNSKRIKEERTQVSGPGSNGGYFFCPSRVIRVDFIVLVFIVTTLVIRS